MTAIYLAGKMRGEPDLNFPAFDEAAARLRAAGYYVFNPAEHDREFDTQHGRVPTTREALTVDTEWICDIADGVAVLTGWEKSLGAKAEVALAKAIGIPVDWVSGWVGKAIEEAA